MAQVNEDQEFSPRKRILRASNVALSVAASGNTTLYYALRDKKARRNGNPNANRID